jgi:pimeloyl-ACP methyl ester carboxylesterase
MASAQPANDSAIGAQFIDLRGTRVELIEKGSGSHLLLLHGLDGIEGASGLIDSLAETFTVIAPSHPGFGESDLPKGFDQVDDLAYFYLDLIDARGLKDVTVVGLSFGGWVAAEILIKKTNDIARLVLASPLGLKVGGPRRKQTDDLFMLSGADVSIRLGTPPAPPPTQMDPIALTRLLRSREATSLYGWSPSLNDPRLARRLHRIDVPTLIVIGIDDILSGPAIGQAFADIIPAATLEKVAGGHRIDDATLAARIVAFAGEQAR